MTFKRGIPEDAADLLDELQEAHQALVENSDRQHDAILQVQRLAASGLLRPIGEAQARALWEINLVCEDVLWTRRAA